MPSINHNISTSTSNTWLPVNTRPVVITGPCSAESKKQLLETCIAAANTGLVHILRAGLWKPRTRPGSFEGIGVKALPWLMEVREQTGLPVMVEVGEKSHIDACLKAGVDYFWIGARSTVNPFYIQKLADAVKGVDIPIFVKNPINPDLSLWIGAIERFRNAGITKLAAIHRGFSNYGEKTYRNRPQWQIAIGLKQQMPEIPLFCDPSHICGNRKMIHDVAQKAMDLNYDGLMIESHIDPDNALSDSQQQLTPGSLKELLESLILREISETSVSLGGKLEKLRNEIDHLDDELIHVLASRMHMARQIGEFKKEKNITILQEKRWREVLQNLMSKAKSLNLSEDFIHDITDAIHDESIDQQTKIMNDPSI
jgi:3-deoxy-7-phosphoheptulonate synthase